MSNKELSKEISKQTGLSVSISGRGHLTARVRGRGLGGISPQEAKSIWGAIIGLGHTDIGGRNPLENANKGWDAADYIVFAG